MKDKNFTEKRKNMIRKLRLCLGLGFLLFLCNQDISTAAKNPVGADSTAQVNQEQTKTSYKAEITGQVNVRVKPGENNNILVHDGKKIKLIPGGKATIIGEEMVGKKLWYEMSFKIGEVELTGYCTSSYIRKGKAIAAPTPEITIAPTPIPTEIPVPTKIIEPTLTPQKPSESAKTSNNSKWIILFSGIFIVVAAAGVTGTVIYLKNKKVVEDDGLEITQQEIKAVELRQQLDKNKGKKLEAENNAKISGIRHPQIKPSIVEQKPILESVRPAVYVKGEIASTQEIMFSKDGNIRENIARENEEKKELRERIEHLKDHDIVTHKYFGRGEVFDNTDIKLIEIRFGSDVRFLSKNSLAAKKLLEIDDKKAVFFYQ